MHQASDDLSMATVQDQENEHYGMSTRHGEEAVGIGQVLDPDESLGSADMLAVDERTPSPRVDCCFMGILHSRFTRACQKRRSTRESSQPSQIWTSHWSRTTNRG